MSQEVVPVETSNVPEEASEPPPKPLDVIPETVQDVPEGSEETDEEYQEDYGEGKFFDIERSKRREIFSGEIEDKEWVAVGEYGEGGKYFIYRPDTEGGEIPSIWGKVSPVSSRADESEEEKVETEEEKELRKQKEALIQEIRDKTMRRTFIRTKNNILQKKLVEHFKKRRMENVLKEDPKGLDLESKYLKRLYSFQEFKQAQEIEIEELQIAMAQYENNAKLLKEEVDEKLKSFMARAYEVSLTLISSKTGKRLNEKQVDRLLRRQILKSEEKGKKKLKYIKLKTLMEEQEHQLKAMEHIGEGLYFYEYEQIKIDNQNYNDKIEERDEELTKVREKTQKVILQLANVREKIYAIEGNIELMEEQVYEVEKNFSEMRKKLTMARKKRDSAREEYSRLKASSGLMTKTALLQDFEDTFFRVKNLSKQLERIKKLLTDKTRQQSELSKVFDSSGMGEFNRLVDAYQPSLLRMTSKRSV